MAEDPSLNFDEAHSDAVELPRDPVQIESPARMALILVLLACIGLLITLSIARRVGHYRAEMIGVNFEDTAARRNELIAHRLQSGLSLARQVAEFVAASHPVDRRTYEGFTKPASFRHPEAYSIAWLPAVPERYRAAHEQAMREDGFADYAVHAFERGAEPSPSISRGLHFPLAYLTTSRQQRQQLGADHASEAQRLAAIEMAIRSGGLASTKPLHFDSQGDDSRIVLIYAPAFATNAPQTMEQRARQLLGMVAVSYMVDQMVSEALAMRRDENLQTHVFDIADPDAPLLLFTEDPAWRDEMAGDLLQAMHERKLVDRYDMIVGGRRWQIVTTASDDWLDVHRSREPLVIALVGLGMTGLIVMITWTQMRFSQRARAYAIERSRINYQLKQRIAEREAAQRALEQANEGLQDTANEMQQLLLAVSHDLKNPLVVSTFSLNALKAAIARDEVSEARTIAQDIENQFHRMRQLIDALTAHTRAGWTKLELADIDMTELVLGVIEDHHQDARRQDVTLNIDGELPVLRVDRIRMIAVFDNLLGNAIKYARHPQGATVTVGCQVQSDQVLLYVRDNGQGIPASHREAVFEIYRRVDESSTEGTGIGLAIVKRSVQAHHGRVWVEETPGGGATFWISLPGNLLVAEHA